MSKVKKPISDPVFQLREALQLFQVGNIAKAVQLVFGPAHDGYDNIDDDLSSLYTDAYLYFTTDRRKAHSPSIPASVAELLTALNEYERSKRA